MFTGSSAGACHRAALRADPLADDDSRIFFARVRPQFEFQTATDMQACVIAPILCGAGAPTGCRACPISGTSKLFLSPPEAGPSSCPRAIKPRGTARRSAQPSFKCTPSPRRCGAFRRAIAALSLLRRAALSSGAFRPRQSASSSRGPVVVPGGARRSPSAGLRAPPAGAAPLPPSLASHENALGMGKMERTIIHDRNIVNGPRLTLLIHINKKVFTSGDCQFKQTRGRRPCLGHSLLLCA